MSDLLTSRSATISECGKYRYWLERQWSTVPPLAFVMLNPSTADAEIDDPTIRRCMAFAKRERAGGIVVVNLFGLRATDPSELERVEDPFGRANIEALGAVLVSQWKVVCAWGAHREAIVPGHVLRKRAKDCAARLWCLGKTKDGHPRHPLYLPSNQPLEAYL